MIKPLFSAVWSVDFNKNHSLNFHHDLCAALYNVMDIYIPIDVFPPLPRSSPNPHQPLLHPDPCSPNSISSTSIFTLSIRSHAYICLIFIYFTSESQLAI